MTDSKTLTALAADFYSAVNSYTPPAAMPDDKDAGLNDIAAIARRFLEVAGEPEHRIRLGHIYGLAQTQAVLDEHASTIEGSIFSDLDQCRRSCRYVLDYIADGIARRVQAEAAERLAKQAAKASKRKPARSKKSKRERLPEGVVGRIDGSPFVFALAKK